ncbi:MAG: HTTM domain-containing protein [Pseudomonadota bacterium]
MAESTHQRALNWLTEPLDIAALALFRILIGGLMCVGALRFMAQGWIESLYLTPSFHFKYWGFEWVTVPGEFGAYLLYWMIACTAFMVAVGFLYRFAIVAFWCLFTYAELMDLNNYLNHYYFISVISLIMCFLSPHRAWSVDAWLRPGIRSDTLPAWQTYWLRFQVGLLYFYAGIAKIESDWLLHAQPLNLWLPPHSGLPILGPFLEMTWVHYVFSWFAFVFDTTIIAFMLWRRTRLFAFGVILVFHYFTHLFFNIGLFPLIMIFSVLVFFDASWPRILMRHIGIRDEGSNHFRTRSSAVLRWTPPGTVFASAVIVFCLIQFLMPLRHWAYPGSVLWHEQGMRYSWRVMLRDKSGSVEYRVVTNTGIQTIVSPHTYLTEDQYREMAGQPDMILQLAHHVADEFNARGLGPVKVYADARVSLNGRSAHPLIYPDVDLTTVEDGLARAAWITPAPVEPPPLQAPLRLVARQ